MVTPYTLGTGWTRRAVLESCKVTARFTGVAQGRPDVVSYAYVANNSNVAECCFLTLNKGQIEDAYEYKQVHIG